MSDNRLAYLLEGYIKRILNKDELIELRKIAADTEARERIARLSSNHPVLQELRAEKPPAALKQGIMDRLEQPRVLPDVVKMAPWLKVAIAILIAVIGAWVWMGVKPLYDNATVKQESNNQARVTDRYMVLPDSSTVIVHAGSKLEYADDFNEKKREVILTGEAYFDVKKDSRKPFIIRAGGVKTTVLGTAFLVKAYPGTKAVTVTVSSGRVRVEDEKQVLGELSKDQQLVYHADAVSSEQNEVSAVKEMNWVSRGMDFRSAYFGNVMEALGQRYGVTVVFANPQQANCQMTASFIGTESLESVLQVLCTVTGSSYQQEGKVITITGKDCND